MTEWIVGNAWWVAPALTFAGVGMLVGALLWPRQPSAVGPNGIRITGWDVVDTAESAQRASEIMSAVHRRGRHLRTD